MNLHVLTILPDRITIPVRPGETILEASRRYGYSFRIGCKEGGCGICKVKVLSGRIGYNKVVADSVVTESERSEGICLLCRAIPRTDVEVILENKLKLIHGPFSEKLYKKALKCIEKHRATNRKQPHASKA
jgi:CDP-4-dehydro-6-deoxyglucose reductase